MSAPGSAAGSPSGAVEEPEGGSSEGPTIASAGSIDRDELIAIGRAAGLAAVGVTGAAVLEPARSVLTLRKRAGLAGEMQFTYRNPQRSTDPARVLPGARSLVAAAWSYGRWRRPEPVSGRLSAEVARYSWHDHYHDLEQALQPMADHLVERGYRARIVADTNALVDRNVAWAAGIGWYGKNSNLLLPDAGSWFVLGAIVTDAELEPTGPPLDDGCGACNQCIEDCPTDAIIAPGVVDATRCLAWIVQAGGSIPIEYRAAIGNRIYGCDDCQVVCPPNRALDRETAPGNTIGADQEAGPVAERERAWVEVDWLLSASDDQIIERHGRWYIADRNVDFIRRTALVVLGNTAEPAIPDVDAILTRYLASDRPLLRAHAVWAARRLGRSDLLTAIVTDPDPAVSAELATAVEARFQPSDWGR
ncbi:MAG: tRNA epoxyqueuosine(34) reductase QueG [Acidimicrobiales bacterium]